MVVLVDDGFNLDDLEDVHCPAVVLLYYFGY